MSKEKSFEVKLNEIEALINSLENDQLTLEDSMKKYKSGMALISDCNLFIEKIESELEIISKE